MKFTQSLCKIHIGKGIRYLWQHQRERKVIVSKAEQILSSKGFQVEDALKLFANPQSDPQLNLKENKEPCETLIDDISLSAGWKDKNCYMFKNTNLLQGNIPQACLLTNTIQVDDKLPQTIKDLSSDIPDILKDSIKRIVYTSTIYDAQQAKLPKLKDPTRPTWVFPRQYGITSTKKMYNVTKKFLQLCESFSGLGVARYRTIVHNGHFRVGIGKENNFIQFNLKMDLMMTSSLALLPITNVNAHNEIDLPDFRPLHYCLGLTKAELYESDMYPLNTGTPMINVHTIFVNNDPEEVKNITELPVSANQIHARSLIKSFTAAAACARQKYGKDVKELPTPIVVQCIQSDGQNFHFSVFQLNTLNMDDQNMRNFWWSEPSVKLYESAMYENGQPCLRDYNDNVFKKFYGFYKNT